MAFVMVPDRGLRHALLPHPPVHREPPVAPYVLWNLRLFDLMVDRRGEHDDAVVLWLHFDRITRRRVQQKLTAREQLRHMVEVIYEREGA